MEQHTCSHPKAPATGTHPQQEISSNIKFVAAVAAKGGVFENLYEALRESLNHLQHPQHLQQH